MIKSDYRKIIDELFEGSFPLLKSRIIFVSKSKILCLQYSAFIIYFIFFSWIIVHPKTDKYSRNELKSVLAHELSHLYIIANLNFFQKIKFGIVWLFTKKGKKDFERDADTLAIRKGYGQRLFDRVIKTERELNKEENIKRKERGYLTPEEIKNYIKKFKK